MATNFTMPSMFDTRYAMDRQMEEDAHLAGQSGFGGRYGMYYNSSLGGDIRNAGLMSLAGMFGGGGDPRMQKQMAIDEIMQQYPDPQTAQDFIDISGALRQAGLYEEADRAFSMANEITSSMPQPKDKPDNIQLYEYYKRNGGTDDFRTFLQSIKGKGVTINTGDTSTPGWEAIDKAYAEDYLNWSMNSADMIGQVGQLKTVLTALESGENLTGAGIGLMPDWYNYLANPESMANKERVAEVVQRNLKLILGGQFSEREGKQLIDRAYNPALPEKENIARVKRLILQMEEGIKARQAMIQHFEATGTMQGYKGVRPNIQSFYNAMEGIQPGDVRDGYVFIGGDPALPGNWKLESQGG